MKIKAIKLKDLPHLTFYSLIIIVGVLWIYPFFLVIFNAFKPMSDMMNNFLGLPREWDFSRFTDVWQRLRLGRLFANTFLYTVSSVTATVFLGSMAAYNTDCC